MLHENFIIHLIPVSLILTAILVINFKQPIMKTKALLSVSILILLKSLQPVFSQNTQLKASDVQLPFYLKELQQPAPPEEMKYTEPKLYEHLLKRRAMLTGILQKEVHDKKLPETALDILKPADPVLYNNVSENNSADKTEGANIHLVKDINHSTNSNPSNNLRGFRNTFAVLKKCVYYAANDGIHGMELWRSDGTAAGTYMVKDINDHDTASSYPSYITQFKDKIYFRAYNPATGYEMYQSDGTANGTLLFKDVDSGAGSGYPGQFTIVESKLFFAAAYGTQLWKTDGTAAGTALVEDLGNNYWYVSGMTELTAVNNLLFFSVDFVDNGLAFETHDRELWRSDGTLEGTFWLKNTYGTDPANFTSFNNHLFFTEYNYYVNRYGKTLWVSDGTDDGTSQVSNPDNVIVNSYFGHYYYNNQAQTIPLLVANDCLYFVGSTAKTGTELYKYNVNKGIKLVRDITPGAAGSDFSTESLRSLNNNIYFSLPDSDYKNFSFWKSGGYEGNTRSIKSLPGNINPYSYYATDSLLYFSLNYSNNNEPWTSDGTASGTKILKDINPAAGSGSGYFTAANNNNVFFSAYSDEIGQELWMTKGTTASTKLVKDMNTTAITGSAVSRYSFSGMALDSNTLIFSAYTTQYGSELWKTDGTDAGTVLVADVNPGEHSSNPYLYEVKNGKSYFTAYDEPKDSDAIYVTDGTATGTKKIAIGKGYIRNIRAADNGNIFYATGEYEYSDNYTYYSLWKTDSTGVSLRLSWNIDPDFNITNNTCFFTQFGYLYHSGEPYISDGTVHGTHILVDMNTAFNSPGPGSYTPFKDKTLFRTSLGLYKSDGNKRSTLQLSSVIPQLYYADTFPTFQGKIYFVGYDTTYRNYGLYSTNGTVAGTVVVNYGLSYSPNNPSRFAVGDSVLYFNTNNSQLWKVTGTKPATASQIKNIDKNTTYPYITNLSATGNTAYFLYGGELWKSNGTPGGTKKIDNTVLFGLAYTDNLTAVGNKLFFTGGNLTYGDELYVINNAADKSSIVNNAVAKALTKSTLSAQLLNNPFYNDLKINVTSLQQQQLTVIISNNAGQKIVSKAIIANTGTNTVSFNCSS